jgi:phosphatidylglycerophosphatase C
MALGWIVGGRGGAKEVLLAAAFGGLTVAEFARQAEDFAHARLLRQLRPAGTAALAAHREAGHRVVIVSASPEPLLRPVAAALQAELVATRLATPGGRVTGRLNGRNCWGPEKLRRLREHIGVPFRLVAAYGDSRGDHELLAAAETAWRRSFPASVTR